jgi:hypothetical protein
LNSDFECREAAKVTYHEEQLELILDLTERVYLLENLMRAARARRGLATSDVSFSAASRRT